MRATVRELVTLAACTAILFVGQIALAFLPNIEVVSLLIILYTLTFKKRVLWIIYGFALLEGMLYGFSFWWISYLYVWTILAGVTWCFRKMDSALGWAVLSAAFGLNFGILCEISRLFILGWNATVAEWISGIPFDLAHCFGNFAAALVLYRPLRTLLRRFFPEGKPAGNQR